MSGEGDSKEFDRRELLAKGTGALVAAGLAGSLVSRAAGAVRVPGRRESARQAGARPVNSIVLETVTGPVHGSDITFAMAHEHLFVDFLGPTDPGYMDVNWSDVTAACAASTPGR